MSTNSNALVPDILECPNLSHLWLGLGLGISQDFVLIPKASVWQLWTALYIIVTLTYGLPSSLHCTYIYHFNCCSNVHMHVHAHYNITSWSTPLPPLTDITMVLFWQKKSLQMLPYLLGIIIKCVPLPHYPMTNLSWSCGGSEQDQLGSQRLNSSGSLWLTSSSTNELGRNKHEI